MGLIAEFLSGVSARVRLFLERLSPAPALRTRLIRGDMDKIGEAMLREKEERESAVKSVVQSCELLLQQAKRLEQASGSGQSDYGALVGAIHRTMDCSSRVDRKIEELSLLL